MSVSVRNIPAMPTERLDVTYDGPALVDHQMDIRALAPALLALADAIQAAQAAVDDSAAPPTLQIVGQPQAGSFAIDFIVQSNILEDALNFFTGKPTTAAANVGGLIGMVLLAIGGIKRIRNRAFRKEQQPDGTIRIVTSDGDFMDLPPESVRMIESDKFRVHINSAIDPVRQDGIDSMVLSSEDSGAEQSILRSDATYFETNQVADEVVSEGTRVVLVNIENVPFKPNLVWRLSEGDDSSFTATLDDLDFRGKMHRREVQFGDGDQLRVELHEVQMRNPRTSKLKIERSITKVLEHIPAITQPTLWDDEATGS